MKKILVVDESSLFRDFLKQKLEEFGFEVIISMNGLDGSAKLRREMPDLLIMDYYLSRLSAIELLAKKAEDPNTSGIPVILAMAMFPVVIRSPAPSAGPTLRSDTSSNTRSRTT